MKTEALSMTSDYPSDNWYIIYKSEDGLERHSKAITSRMAAERWAEYLVHDGCTDVRIVHEV